MGYDGVYTIWRQEGLTVPQKQPKRVRLWRTDGSCVRLRPTHRHPVWSYDFVAERTQDGRLFRILNVLDEYTRECLASVVARRLGSQEVILLVAELFLRHGVPQHSRSDNVLHAEVKSHERKNLRSAALGSCETIPLLPSQWASTS